MGEIIRPQGFVPGFTDKYCSNELIIAGLATGDMWQGCPI